MRTCLNGSIPLYFRQLFLVCFFQSIFSPSFSQQKISIIPQPVELKEGEGSFLFNSKTILICNPTDTLFRKLAESFSDQVYVSAGIKLKIVKGNKSRLNSILFLKESALNLSPEGYHLDVSTSGVKLISGNDTGCFYALQTLYQLLPAGIYGKLNSLHFPVQIPCCQIVDYPRYTYRGMHLDVCRHFFPVEFIKKYIDLLAMHKMNRFHWHLTEDQGWRIEIKKYPKLTSVGSLRKESMIGFYDDNTYDGKSYGGFYTQDQIREIINYATEKYVTIIPEIEMPGHSLAALAAYPELGCKTDTTYEVATKWGVFNEVYCPTESTFSFLEDVLTEVCNLFPGKYIHIGGDECPKINWKNSTYCQELMKTENLKNEHELQSYFIRRIEKFILSKGKKIIGWDEILEGGLAPEATVMSWRGIDGGIAAAREQHDVIMTPGSHCYLDHYQSDPSTEPIAIGGYTTLQKVYSYEPTPKDSLTPEQQKHILGAQGNLWTEYITDSKHLEYMAFPRAIALAEVVWSPDTQRNWTNFSLRLLYHFKRLDVLNVNYAQSLFDVTASIGADTIKKEMFVTLNKGIEEGEIYFTTNHAIPDKQASLYKQPVAVRENTILKARLFYNNQSGKILSKEIHMHKASALPYMLKDSWKQYDGAGKYGLTDGIYGMPNRYNTWVGFSGKDLDAVIELKEIQTLNSISVNFYNKNRAWIFLPDSVVFEISNDGINYSTIYKNDSITDPLPNSIVNIEIKKTFQARYVRVYAKNIGKCPPGHEGEGKDAWLFADEIVVE